MSKPTVVGAGHRHPTAGDDRHHAGDRNERHCEEADAPVAEPLPAREELEDGGQIAEERRERRRHASDETATAGAVGNAECADRQDDDAGDHVDDRIGAAVGERRILAGDGVREQRQPCRQNGEHADGGGTDDHRRTRSDGTPAG
ncbi:MAG: hypothetical protein M3508_09465 [Actinomycetota bacterium]|nr:hypothetical protein [Actinomycetota bacterium]